MLGEAIARLQSGEGLFDTLRNFYVDKGEPLSA
jgi:hypothetical protein